MLSNPFAMIVRRAWSFTSSSTLVVASSCAKRLLSTADQRRQPLRASTPPQQRPAQQQQQQISAVHRRLAGAPKKKASAKSKRSGPPSASHRVSAHVLASTHDPAALAAELRRRFGAGAVQVFGGEGSGSLIPGGSDIHAPLIEGVVHLTAPATGTQAAHGSPPASAFFFIGTKDADELSSSACVSVWWGAESSFEDALLRDLRAVGGGRAALSRAQQLDRLAIPKAVIKWQHGERSQLGRDEANSGVILIDDACDARSRILDQLSFSHALQRHMKLLVLEEEMERILSSVKRIVRQGLGRRNAIMFRRFLPQSLGGIDSGASTMTVSAHAVAFPVLSPAPSKPFLSQLS